MKYKKIMLVALLTCFAGPSMQALWLPSWMPSFSISRVLPKLKLNKKNVAIGVGALYAVHIVAYGLINAYKWYVGESSKFERESTVKGVQRESLPVQEDIEKSKEKDTTFHYENRTTWSDLCKKLPTNEYFWNNGCVGSGGITLTNKAAQKLSEFVPEYDKVLMSNELLQAVGKTKEVMQDQMFSISKWTDRNIRTKGDNFEPFVQRLDIPADANVVIHGDFHGDIISFITELDSLEEQGFLEEDSFKIADPDGYMLFLGDYTDRGFYGAEVIYTICRLKLANPNKVFMVRGNHEDIGICRYYGFAEELFHKLGMEREQFKQVCSLYEYMPVALYLGHNGNYIQCCHGGLEHGYNPAKLLLQDVKYDLLGVVDRERACKDCNALETSMPADEINVSRRSFQPTCCMDGATGYSIGFLWHDFVKFEDGNSVWSLGRGLAANKDLTEKVLKYQNDQIKRAFEGSGQAPSVKGVFRAHQHTGSIDRGDDRNLMGELIDSYGVYKLWHDIETDKIRSMADGLVWTFNVAPDSGYGVGCQYGFDAYAIVRPREFYENWTLEICNTQVIADRTYLGYREATGGAAGAGGAEKFA